MALRVLHYLSTTRTEAGGTVRAAFDLCTALAQRGHHVTFVTSDAADAPEEWRAGDPGAPRLVEIPAPALPGDVYTRAGLAPLRSLIAEHDCAHVHGVWQYSSVQVCRVARALGKPYFVTVHGMLDDWCMSQRGLKKRLYLKLVGRRWLEGAARVHMTVQAEQDQARKWFPRGRGVVIPYVVDLTPFQALPGPEMARERFPVLASGAPSVLFLSRIHEKKNPETLLRAMRLLKQRGIRATLIVAGTGDDRYVESVKALTRVLGLTEKDVAFVGLVTGDLKLSLYQACTVFALATKQENFGFVFIEALACGTPVVTTRGTDIWPELQQGGGASIVDATPEATAQAIGELVSDPERAAAMGARGRQWALVAMDPQSVVERFEAMYRQEI